MVCDSFASWVGGVGVCFVLLWTYCLVGFVVLWLVLLFAFWCFGCLRCDLRFLVVCYNAETLCLVAFGVFVIWLVLLTILVFLL